MAANKDLVIQQGKTFSLVLRWETERVTSKPITAISLAAGAPRLTVPAHGAPNGWRCAVTRVGGMKQINAENYPPSDTDFRPATVIDANTIEFNGVTPCDDSGKEWPAYTSGGFIQYNTPVDLTGYTARMEIKDKIGGTVLASADSADTPLDILDIAIDTTGKTITLTISATDTAEIAWKRGVYDLEMVSSSGVVTAILTGSVNVTREVTT